MKPFKVFSQFNPRRNYWGHPNFSGHKNKDPFYQVKDKMPKVYNSVEEAVNVISSDTNVYVHGAAMTPATLLQGMCDHAVANKLTNIRPVHMHLLGNLPYLEEQYRNHFRDNSLFAGDNTRKHVNAGYADYTPIFLSDIPKLFESKQFPVHTSLVQVSPPDKHGYCSLGTSVDCARAAILSSTHVVGLMNKHVPRTFGDSHVHISQFDAVYQEDKPIYTVSPGAISSEFEEIGRIIAHELIPDRACLQLGIGAIPNATLNALKHHKELGIHTEMFSDGILGLMNEGVITNNYKKLHCGRIVSSFCFGTQELYDTIDENPLFNMYDCSYVNDTHTIRTNDNVHSINSCIEIDLTGQVVADSIGTNIYSGVGGQMDFVRGAALSDGGKAIIAMQSQTKKGQSKIVPVLKEGAGVVTTRAHVQYIVTEYGYVNLWGKTLRERAQLLISIAHPDHREALEKTAREMFG